ncbi:MAG: zinc-dependent metalloprotease [Gemmatimonadota bacterium]|nr:zinc-dependent metalloprotease [Gemmatimonadota bacterium]
MRPAKTALPLLSGRAAATAGSIFLLLQTVLLSQPTPIASQTAAVDAGLPTIADYTRGMDGQPGYFPLYWDDAGGRLLLEVGRWDEQFLYLTSLATGVGSNALGLDRGNIQSAYLAHFERVGPKVMLVLDNPGFRAETDPTDALVRSVEESFLTSTVGGFAVVAEEDGRALVDGTSFFLRDVVGVAARLQAANQGSYRLDANRSAIFLPRTKAFPENTEVEASLTFESERPGSEIQRHAPDGRAMTLRQHHSLVMLPDDGYTPRRFDPRIGVFAIGYYDFGKPFDDDYQTALARRHRLVKADPSAAMSEPVEPIVYYLDPAVPEPYRTAFRIGGVWWNQVFEAAGFIDAFRIEDMPADMDPMDARYHVIQWVHRTEAGSSIGPSFVDPRTGEIIKAAVRMDSYRSLANYNTFAGAAGVDGEWYAGEPPGVDGEEFVMMRRRQHSAHEIGHTLGLAHNFISISDGHASVMDYPAPVIELREGRLDLSGAYRAGPGAYDTLAIRYAYASPADGEREEDFLNGLLLEAQERGWRFITNPDAGADNSHPDATWWINGSDVLDEFERVSEVRRFMIDSFDERAIEPGEPMHKLRERFAPVYFSHRATYEAAIKTIGGMEYTYGVRGDILPVTELVSDDRVRRAMGLLSDALAPEELAIPESVLAILAPRSFGWVGGGPAWSNRAGPAFDQIGAATTVASEIVGGVLAPARTARVVAFHARNPSLPSLEEVVARLVDDTWGRSASGSEAALVRVVQNVVVDELLALAANEDATTEARAAAEWGLRRAQARAAALASGTSAAADPNAATPIAHAERVVGTIDRFLGRPWAPGQRTGAPLAPGWARDRPEGHR